MDLEIRRYFFVDLGQELCELGGPVAAVQQADGLVGGHFRAAKRVVLPART